MTKKILTFATTANEETKKDTTDYCTMQALSKTYGIVFSKKTHFYMHSIKIMTQCRVRCRKTMKLWPIIMLHAFIFWLAHRFMSRCSNIKTFLTSLPSKTLSSCITRFLTLYSLRSNKLCQHNRRGRLETICVL